MDFCSLLILSCAMMATSGWSIPFYPVARGPPRITRFAHPPPHHRLPARGQEEPQWQRPKRDHDDFDHDHDHGRDRDHSHDHGHGRGSSGITGPVHTFVKTDKNANYKWGVRHHVGNKFAA